MEQEEYSLLQGVPIHQENLEGTSQCHVTSLCHCLGARGACYTFVLEITLENASCRGAVVKQYHEEECLQALLMDIWWFTVR